MEMGRSRPSNQRHTSRGNPDLVLFDTIFYFSFPSKLFGRDLLELMPWQPLLNDPQVRNTVQD